MYVSITSVLLGLGGKCLLNWTLVFFQKNHICRSLLGVFSVSLAVVDTALTLTVIAIHICSNTYIVLLGLQLTRYHICLLVQILGQVYKVVQWPVVVTAGLDHFFTVTQRTQAITLKAKFIFNSLVTCFMWYVAVLYVFLLSDFRPVLEDVSHHQVHRCWMFDTSQMLIIATLLLLTLGCAALRAGHPLMLLRYPPPPSEDQIKGPSQTHHRRGFGHQALQIFLNTWTFFLVCLAMLLLLPLGIPTYLDLNVAWLCFLNSLLIAVVLCAVCPASQSSHDLAAVPPDSFCEWKFNFILAAEDET